MQVWEGLRGGLPGTRQAPRSAATDLHFLSFLSVQLTCGANVYENHWKKHGFRASTQTAKNAWTFVNLGVLGCLGPLEAAKKKLDFPMGFLGSVFEANEAQGSPLGTAFKKN